MSSSVYPIFNVLLKIFNKSLWYKVRDTLLGQNHFERDIKTKTALELASVFEHPNAVWLTRLFAGRVAFTEQEARHVFLGCENDPRALCFAASLLAILMRFVEWLILETGLRKRRRN
jgi:hypothetical protein